MLQSNKNYYLFFFFSFISLLSFFSINQIVVQYQNYYGRPFDKVSPFSLFTIIELSFATQNI